MFQKTIKSRCVVGWVGLLAMACAPGNSNHVEPVDAVTTQQNLDDDAIPLEGSPRKGSDDAEVTIVLASEFECPFCSRVNPAITRIMKEYDGKVALVYKHNPLSFHKDAMAAAMAAEAAHRQGKFWQMYELLFANQKQLKRENYLAWAETLGLDVDEFEADLDSADLAETIKRDQELVRSLGARGVPSFWINGQHIVGAQPYSVLKSIIDKHLDT